MKDKYFEYEKWFITIGLCAVVFLLVGCQEPIVKQEGKVLFKVEGKDIEYICNSNGYWYKKEGTTKIQIMKDGDRFLTCGDERL